MNGLHQSSDMPKFSGSTRQVRLASVLVPLFWHQSGWHLLFIRRVVNEHDRHSGQVAFPGGRRDDSDTDAVHTALREADEEVGLSPADVSVLLTLDDYVTSSNYQVSPVVATVPWPYDYQAQPSEVDRIFSIPLAWLSDPANVELRERRFERDGKSLETTVVYFREFDNEVLWGASARITVAFLRAIHRGQLILPVRS